MGSQKHKIWCVQPCLALCTVTDIENRDNLARGPRAEGPHKEAWLQSWPYGWLGGQSQLIWRAHPAARARQEGHWLVYSAAWHNAKGRTLAPTCTECCRSSYQRRCCTTRRKWTCSKTSLHTSSCCAAASLAAHPLCYNPLLSKSSSILTRYTFWFLTANATKSLSDWHRLSSTTLHIAAYSLSRCSYRHPCIGLNTVNDHVNEIARSRGWNQKLKNKIAKLILLPTRIKIHLSKYNSESEIILSSGIRDIDDH